MGGESRTEMANSAPKHTPSETGRSSANASRVRQQLEQTKNIEWPHASRFSAGAGSDAWRLGGIGRSSDNSLAEIAKRSQADETERKAIAGVFSLLVKTPQARRHSHDAAWKRGKPPLACHPRGDRRMSRKAGCTSQPIFIIGSAPCQGWANMAATSTIQARYAPAPSLPLAITLRGPK